jgi:hypothetical protein
MSSSTSHHAWHDPWRAAGLWTGLLAGPLVWAGLLETHYVLSYVACEVRQEWFLHAATALAVALVAAAGWVGWRSGPAEDDQRRSPPVTRATSESRARWMSLAGVALSGFFIVVILSMEIPIIVLRTCQ